MVGSTGLHQPPALYETYPFTTPVTINLHYRNVLDIIKDFEEAVNRFLIIGKDSGVPPQSFKIVKISFMGMENVNNHVIIV